MSKKAFDSSLKPKAWRPYLSLELKVEIDEFFAEHPELDPIGAIESWIRKAANEYRRRAKREKKT